MNQSTAIITPISNTITPESSSIEQYQQSKQSLPPFSSLSSSSTMQSPPTLSRPTILTTQFSILFTYKRIILPLFVPPLLCFLTPKLISISLYFVNLLSNGCVLGSTIASFLIINYVYNEIKKYAPDENKCNYALSYMKYRFEFIVFGSVSYVMRLVMNLSSSSASSMSGSGEEGESWERYLLKASFLNVNVGNKIVAGLLILSLLVGSRFIGYFAIVQCPTFPQPNNPYQIITKNFISIVKMYFHNMLNPDEPKNQSYQNQQQHQNEQHTMRKETTDSSRSNRSKNGSSINYRQVPRCYSKPTIIQTLIQIIIHLVLGLIFGFFIHQELNPTSLSSSVGTKTDTKFEKDLQLLFLLSCALTCIFTFMTTYISTTSSSIKIIPVATRGDQDYHNYHELLSHDNEKSTLPYLSLSCLCSSIYHEMIQQIQQSSVLFYCIISPLIAIMWIYLLNGSNLITIMMFGSNNFQSVQGLRKKIVVTFVEIYLTSLFMSLYLIAVDIFTRKVLTTRGLDVYKLISQSNITFENNTDDDKNVVDESNLSHEVSIESVVVSIILAGFGFDTIDDVLCPRMIEQNGKFIRPMKLKRGVGGLNNSWVPSSSTCNFSNIDLEGMEMRRNKDMIQKVASAILSGAITSYTTFEEDLLKFMVLELLGGCSGMDNTCATNKSSFEICSPGRSIPFRGYKTIMRFLRTMNQGSVQILSIVRALCAYAGGIGEALTHISCRAQTSLENPATTSQKFENDSFSLQPCAVLSATYAIQAASRFILLNMKNQKSRFNHLSLFIPVILQTSYTLRCGVLDYAKYLYDSPNSSHNYKSTMDTRGETFVNFCSMKLPELTKLVKSCDDCVLDILHLVGGVDREGNSETNSNILEMAEIKVDDHVRDWIISLLESTK